MENIILFIGVLLLPCIAYSLISFNYGKYSGNELKSKLSGFEVARKILDENNLKSMYIVEVKGSLNDHYDYNQKVIRLSTDVYHGTDLTAAVVASRICSYAILDKKNDSFMKFRSLVNPFITFDIYASYIIVIVGICLQDYAMVKLATLLMLVALIFHIVTLTVEKKAIKESISNLKDNKILNNEEIEESSMLFKVSNYTFIMSILTCISNLFNELIYNLKKRG